MAASETKKSLRLLVAFLLIVCVSGCTKQVAGNIHNNSGADITIIRSRDGEPEQRIEVRAGSSVLLRDWLFWSYRMARKDKVMRYVPQSPGSAFVVAHGFGPWTKRIFKAQIEPDGRIFMLKPEQAFPARDFVVQPAGFPLAPNEIDGIKSMGSDPDLSPQKSLTRQHGLSVLPCDSSGVVEATER